MTESAAAARKETDVIPCITDTYSRLQHLMTPEEQANAVAKVFPKYLNGRATEPDPVQPENILGL